MTLSIHIRAFYAGTWIHTWSELFDYHKRISGLVIDENGQAVYMCVCVWYERG